MVLPTRYNKNELYRAIKQPRKFLNEARYLYSSSKFRYKYRNAHQRNPLLEDWDNLFILDACRHDILDNINAFDVEVNYRILNSSTSPEFCDNYMSGNQFYDTVYVTANPFGAQVDDDCFYNKIITFENSGSSGNRPGSNVESATYQGWEPEVVYRTALNSHEKYPNKRQIVHFMQPHAPYFGDKAELLRKRLNDDGIRFWAWDEDLSEGESNENVVSHLLSAAQNGYITADELTEVYIENVELVVEYAKKLSAEIGGKTIITSDHGEMLRWKIGHGADIYTEGLRKVPWVVLDDDQRRDVVEEEKIEGDETTVVNTNQQLRALGYK